MNCPMATEFVRYRGEKYWLQNSGYFQRDRDKSGLKIERLLHRVKWENHHGPVPIGCVIHHKNGNKRDNKLSNLEPVEAFTHQSEHMRERWLLEPHRKRFMNGLRKAREAAKEWHRSKEGNEWHKQHGIEVWRNMKKYEMECVQCGKKYMAFRQDISKFCSNACSCKSRPIRKISKRCIVCGGEFVSNIYKNAKHCSPACSNKTMWKTRNRLKQGPQGRFLKTK